MFITIMMIPFEVHIIALLVVALIIKLWLILEMIDMIKCMCECWLFNGVCM